VYIIKYVNGEFLIADGVFEKPLTDGVLNTLSGGGIAMADLSGHGLALIHRYMAADVYALKIKSYGGIIRAVRYKGLTIKNSALFGLTNDSLSWGAVEQLQEFCWWYARKTLYDTDVTSPSSLAKCVVAKNRGFYLDCGKEMSDYLERAYFGGRLQAIRPGTYKNIR
jgi:hypothetical protein